MENVIDKDLLEILICPALGEELVLDETTQTLKSVDSGKVYPIKDGIIYFETPILN